MRCSVWREAAENVAESLHRGTRVVVTGRLKSRSYETKEGEKRTVVEMDVDEVGPSLRYATAKVNKTQRGGGNFGGGNAGGGGQEDPWSSGPPTGGASSGGQASGGGGWGNSGASAQGGPSGGGNAGGAGGGQQGQGGPNTWGSAPQYDEPPF